MAQTTAFKYSPLDIVYVRLLSCEGRIARCITDSGPMTIYAVDYVINGDYKRNEFYEDELDVLNR